MSNKFNIDWSKQHCGVIHGSFFDVVDLMPDLRPVLETFPNNPLEYTWDVKVHMLMPGQYPCIPNWHRDMVPRDEEGHEVSSLINSNEFMYLWLSGSPLTEFKYHNGETYFINPEEWHPFNQEDEHRGHPAKDFLWRGLIRACPKSLGINKKNINNPFENKNPLRRHCQVYLDAGNFSW